MREPTPPPSSATGVRHRFTAERADHGVRLDRSLAARFPGHSRSRLQRAVKAGQALVNGLPAKPGRTLQAGDEVILDLEAETRSYAMPERMDLELLYEDQRLVVVNKPPGLTVHPGAGERRGTLANALAYRFGELSSLQGPLRPGIVHRLDRDTSGVILVALDDDAHRILAAQFKARTVAKTYIAVTRGLVEFDADLISLPIGRDVRNHERMAIRHDNGRASETYYEVLERFSRHTLVEVHPRSGRTHQIRVHMAAIGHPLVADRVYSRPEAALRGVMNRQALHAYRLVIRHPSTGDEMTFEAPLPPDMNHLIEYLRAGGASTPASREEELGLVDDEPDPAAAADEDVDGAL